MCWSRWKLWACPGHSATFQTLGYHHINPVTHSSGGQCNGHRDRNNVTDQNHGDWSNVLGLEKWLISRLLIAALSILMSVCPYILLFTWLLILFSAHEFSGHAFACAMCVGGNNYVGISIIMSASGVGFLRCEAHHPAPCIPCISPLWPLNC